MQIAKELLSEDPSTLISKNNILLGSNYTNSPTDCLQQIESALIQYQEYVEKISLKDSTLLTNIQDCLYKISWRSTEIPSNIKFTDNSILSLFRLRNWLMLDYLANTINQLTDEKVIVEVAKNLNDDLMAFKNIIPQLVSLIASKSPAPNVAKEKKVFLSKLNALVSFYFDRYLLEKIVACSSSITKNVDSKNDEAILDFLNDDINRMAVYRAYEIIGEASKNISHELKHLHQGLPWHGVKEKAASEDAIEDKKTF